MAVTINFYDKALEYIGDGTIDLDGDTFKLALMDASVSPTHTFVATRDRFSQMADDELATGNGYTAPGQALTSVTWVEAAGTLTFDAADVTWTASGGDIGPSDYSELYDDSPVSVPDPMICSISHDGAKTANSGTDFKVQWHVNGIFTGAFTDA